MKISFIQLYTITGYRTLHSRFFKICNDMVNVALVSANYLNSKYYYRALKSTQCKSCILIEAVDIYVSKKSALVKIKRGQLLWIKTIRSVEIFAFE